MNIPKAARRVPACGYTYVAKNIRTGLYFDGHSFRESNRDRARIIPESAVSFFMATWANAILEAV